MVVTMQDYLVARLLLKTENIDTKINVKNYANQRSLDIVHSYLFDPEQRKKSVVKSFELILAKLAEKSKNKLKQKKI